MFIKAKRELKRIKVPLLIIKLRQRTFFLSIAIGEGEGKGGMLGGGGCCMGFFSCYVVYRKNIYIMLHCFLRW